MPHDVIMPALGMAQETGLIVAWRKEPGDAVAKGEILFEVETDKATMEVEAQGDGYLAKVIAEAGTEVPVGEVIATLSDSAEDANAPAASNGTDEAPPTAEQVVEAPVAGDLPAGKDVIMPTLGMAQDTGLLVAWHKAAGDEVAADDVLFEVETDKSTVEVNAGVSGYVAALLAEEGEEIPVGQTIAIISAAAPVNPITRSASAAPAPARAAEEPAAAPKPEGAAPTQPAAKVATPMPQLNGRILVSPKARRLAREQGLDLQRLVDAGHPQPFRVRDLEALKTLPDASAETAVGVTTAAGRLTAEVPTETFTDFVAWAEESANLTDASALLAGLCAGSMGGETVVAVERFGETRTYAASPRLGATTASDEAPTIRLRDLRFTAITSVQAGAEQIPALTVTQNGNSIAVTLEYASGQLSPEDAIALISNFAGRMEQPLRHLL